MDYIGREPDFDLSDAVYGMATLDIDALRKAAQDGAASTAESACIYYSRCLDVISDYESHPDASDLDDMLGERKFSAAEWQDAAQAYASAILHCVLTAKASRLVDEVEEAAVDLEQAINRSGGEPEASEPTVSSSCPYGWASHDREDSGGVHYWVSGQLDGLNGVAIEVAGIWLSYSWTPTADEDEDEGEEG